MCEHKSIPEKGKLIEILSGLAAGKKADSLPFNNFKLGKYLKYPLGGAAKVLVAANIREADKSYDLGVEGVKLLQVGELC